MKIRARKNIPKVLTTLLFGIGALLSIYTVEGGLRVKSYLNSREILFAQKKAAQEKHVTFDEGSAYEVVNELRSKGMKAYPVFSPANYIHYGCQQIGKDSVLYPLAAPSNSTTVYCNENGPYMQYTSDERGFHNPKGAWNQNSLQIALLGDSFAHGACIPSDANIAAHLRRVYPATLNLGVAGNGPFLMLATLKEYLGPFKPKAVLWLYVEGNDLLNISHERHNPVLQDYLKPNFSQNLSQKQGRIDELLTTCYEDLLQKQKPSNQGWSKTVAFLKATELRHGVFKSTNQHLQETTFKLFETILREARDYTYAFGGELYFIYMPTQAGYINETTFVKPREKVLNIVEKLQIPIMDMKPVIAATGDPLSFFVGRVHSHYTEQGYQRISEEILQVLKSKGVSP